MLIRRIGEVLSHTLNRGDRSDAPAAVELHGGGSGQRRIPPDPLIAFACWWCPTEPDGDSTRPGDGGGGELSNSLSLLTAHDDGAHPLQTAPDLTAKLTGTE